MAKRYIFIPEQKKSIPWSQITSKFKEIKDLSGQSEAVEYMNQFKALEKYMFVPNIKCIPELSSDNNVQIINFQQNGGNQNIKKLVLKYPEFSNVEDGGWRIPYNGYYWKPGTDFYLTGVFNDYTTVGGISKTTYVKEYSTETYIANNENYSNIAQYTIDDLEYSRERLSVFSKISTLSEIKTDFPITLDWIYQDSTQYLECVYLQNLGYIFYNYEFSPVSYLQSNAMIVNDVNELTYKIWGTKYTVDYADLLLENDYQTKVRKYSSDAINDFIIFHEYPYSFDYKGVDSYEYEIALINPKTGELSQPEYCSYHNLDYNRNILEYSFEENMTNDWKVYYIVILRKNYVSYGGDGWYDQIECMFIVIQEPRKANFEFIYSYPHGGRSENIINLEGDYKFSLAQTNYLSKQSGSQTNVYTKNTVYVPTTCKIYSEAGNILSPSKTEDGFFIYDVGDNFQNLTVQYDG